MQPSNNLFQLTNSAHQLISLSLVVVGSLFLGVRFSSASWSSSLILWFCFTGRWQSNNFLWHVSQVTGQLLNNVVVNTGSQTLTKVRNKKVWIKILKLINTSKSKHKCKSCTATDVYCNIFCFCTNNFSFEINLKEKISETLKTSQYLTPQSSSKKYSAMDCYDARLL